MHVVKKNLSETKIQLTLTADQDLLADVKQEVLHHLSAEVKIQGFRPGKAPTAMLEKAIAPAKLQAEFLDRAMNRLYAAALEHDKLRPVDQPKVKVTKFVPYDALEIEAEVEIVGDIKLPDYKKFKLAKPKAEVTAKEVDAMIANLRSNMATRAAVDRAAKKGDELWIDFTGTDAKTKEPIKGADGKDYPLMLGSNTFIPGFEPELIGMKAGSEKTFDITFPKDYAVSALKSRKVTFSVKAKKVQEVTEPALDDAFAAKVGPFKTMADLKTDVKQELQARKDQEADQAYADDLITKLAEKTKVAVPEILITEQIERLERDQRQNLMYRGQTWQEFLEAEGLTEESYRKSLRTPAELRVKAGLMLAEVAEAENIDIAPAELDAQMAALEANYPDPKMRSELLKPESRRSIASRMQTEKTVAKLAEYAGTTT